MGLLAFWFGFDAPVGRRDLRHGLLLGLVKVAIDVATFQVALGIWTLPPHALDLTRLLTDPVRDSGPGWLAVVVLLWSLPFLWIGMSMSARRAADAGLPPWLGMLFFLPYVNWLLIAVLCCLPRRERSLPVHALPVHVAGPRSIRRVRSALLVVGLAVVLGLAMTAFSVAVSDSYGAALFVGTPFAIGAAVGFALNLNHDRTLGETAGWILLVFSVLFALMLLLAVEGLVCLVMVIPLALVPALLGACFGRYLARSDLLDPTRAGALLLLLPVLTVLERSTARPVEHEVRSTVDIAAPPAVVWENVVAFGELPEPPPLLFRFGIAYPRRARIAGEGVGAVRQCEFSTGPFVEPITCWDAPVRLAFDVRTQPPTMTELSPYADLMPRHLDGFFRATRGEFRLELLPDGGTRLHGSTWYRMDVHPQAYWHVLADAVVHWIHLRVMEHVRELAERT